MVQLKPFEGATNRTSVAVFGKGYPIRYPVSYSYWVKKKEGRGSAIGFDTPYEEVTKELVTFRKWHAEPVDAEDKTSPWITAKPKALKALRKILGKSEYVAHEGANTGGANAIYWVEITGTRPGGMAIISNITEGAKKKATSTHAAVEEALLYPLLRGRDVGRWSAIPSAHILMTQDPKRRRGIDSRTMETTYPRGHSYLVKFEKALRARAAFRRYFRDDDPFWSMFNVGEYTLSPWKVVWREQAAGLMAAVVGPVKRRPVVPDHKLMSVDVASSEEGYYLCAALNSAPARLATLAYSIEVSMSPHILKNIRISRFSRKSRTHARLSQLSEAAHKATHDAAEVRRIEDEVDRVAARLWDLTDEELAEIRSSLADLE